jgi:hypothetical protein
LERDDGDDGDQSDHDHVLDEARAALIAVQLGGFVSEDADGPFEEVGLGVLLHEHSFLEVHA